MEASGPAHRVPALLCPQIQAHLPWDTGSAARWHTEVGATDKQGRCPQPCRGLRLAVPACKATRDSHWEMGTDINIHFWLFWPCQSPILLLLGQAVSPGRCAQPWRIPAAAGWHQMKTNGRGDTSASINGSAVSGTLGMGQHWQEEQQRWASTTPGSPGVTGGQQGQPWPSTPPARLCPEPSRRCWQEKELDGIQPWQPHPHHSEPLAPAGPAPALPHTCLSQGAFGDAHKNLPLPMLTHLSGGSGIPEQHVAFPALEGISQHWKGCSAHAVPVQQLPGGGQEQPRDEAEALTLPTFSTP